MAINVGTSCKWNLDGPAADCTGLLERIPALKQFREIVIPVAEAGWITGSSFPSYTPETATPALGEH